MTLFVKKARFWLMALIFFASVSTIVLPESTVAKAADNGLAQRPLMGWSSYSLQVFNPNGGDWVTADRVKAQSDAMHATLQSHGYEYINIDAGWSGSLDAYGRPVPKASLYPQGIKDVVNYVHHNGQKIGLYIIPGISPQVYNDNLPIYGSTCHAQDIVVLPLTTADYWGLDYKIDFSKPCAQSYINSIADLFGSWDIDFIKLDSVTPGSDHNDTSIDARDDVAAWASALAPHHIWLELSWALDHDYVNTWKKYGNGWRVEHDVECYCGTGTAMTTWSNIARLFPAAAVWWRDAGPGGWNDFDSLNVGNGATDGLTLDERQTAMTLWAMSSAQLYIGDDMANLDAFGLSLLTNDEVIAVNQAGHPAHPVSMETNQQVWYANNGDGSYTVGLINLDDSSATVTVNWSDIGLSGPAALRDLYSHTDLGTYNSSYSSVNLPAHGSRLLKIVSKGGTAAVNDDDTGVLYTGNWQRNSNGSLGGVSQTLTIGVNDSSATNSTISPSSASFDKLTSAQADVTTTLTMNGNTWSGIANGGTALVSGTDYTVTGNVVTIKKAYLAAQPVGTTILTFSFSSGAAQTLTVTVSDSGQGRPVDINDNESDITYSGSSWNYQNGRAGLGDYQADVHYTTNNNDFVQYSFTGTGIDFVTGKDSSGGDIDIYVDNVLKGTVSGHKDSNTYSPQQIAYSISGLTNTPHTFKAVKKSGTFMIVDKLTIYVLDMIDPLTASFDKKLTAQADVTTTIKQSGNTLSSIVNGATTLTTGTDYTVSGNVVTIKKEYLASQVLGTTNLTLSFSGGATQNFAITVSDSTPSQTVDINDDNSGITYSGSWNYGTGRAGLGDYQGDVHYTLNNGDYMQYAFTGTGIELITGEDSSGGDIDIYVDDVFQTTVSAAVYSGSYLPQQVVYSMTGLNSGSHTFKAVKKSGTFMIVDKLTVHVDQLITPNMASFDKKSSAQVDVTTTMSTGANTLSRIANGATTLTLGADYTVSGSVVTIKKAYLAAQPVGTTNLTFTFSGGSTQTLTVTVNDTTSSSSNSTISPAVGSFDKGESGQVEITTTVTLNGNTLGSITNGASALMAGIDYSVIGNQVTIKKAYLDSQPAGAINLTFNFSAGATQTLAITMIDSSQGGSYAINDDDGGIAYMGTWRFSGGRTGFGDFHNDVHFAETNNDYFEYAFTGTGITYITEKSNGQGDMDVYVDNVFQQTVSAYSVTFTGKQTLYSISGLSSGAHKLKVVKKSGSYLILDKLKVSVGNLFTPGTASFDKAVTGQADVTLTISQSGSVLSSITNGGTALVAGTDYTVSGNSVTIKKSYLATQPVGTSNLAFAFSGDYQSDVHYTATNNDSFQYTFKGTGIDVITDKSSVQGDMDIYVDKVFKKTVSAYNATKLTQQTVYSISGLSNTTHTIKVVKKSGTQMVLDKLNFTIPTSIQVNDTNSGITYYGTWTHSSGRGVGDYQDDVHMNSTNGLNPPYFQYTFTGTGIEVITEKNSNQGNISIYVDNKFKGTVNTYNSMQQAQQTVYSISGLNNGSHTLKVVKNTGTYFVLDFLRITP